MYRDTPDVCSQGYSDDIHAHDVIVREGSKSI